MWIKCTWCGVLSSVALQWCHLQQFHLQRNQINLVCKTKKKHWRSESVRRDQLRASGTALKLSYSQPATLWARTRLSLSNEEGSYSSDGLAFPFSTLGCTSLTCWKQGARFKVDWSCHVIAPGETTVRRSRSRGYCFSHPLFALETNNVCL